MAPSSRRQLFHNDTRNYGGRVAVYDELINHQMKLLSINPRNYSENQNKSGNVALRRKRPQTTIKPTDLSIRLSRNRKCAENTALIDHQNQIKVMMNKILHYSKKQSIDNIQLKKRATTPLKNQLFNIPLRDGYGIQRQIDAPIHHEAKRRLHALQTFNDSDIHNEKVGIRSIRSASSKSPRLNGSNYIKVLLFTLHLYLHEHELNVLSLFQQNNNSGDGSISTSKFRSILFSLDLGWTQHDITMLVRTLDPNENGFILPITLDTLLRKIHQPPLGIPSIRSPVLTRPSTSLYGRRIQDLKKIFPSSRVQPEE